MGQHELLLILLGVIIIGIAIVVGINLFKAKSIQSSRDAVVLYLNYLAALAQQYYKKTTSHGGGENTLVGFAIPTGIAFNASGIDTISTAGTATQIVFQGIGTEIGGNGLAGVTNRATVTSTGFIITKVN